MHYFVPRGILFVVESACSRAPVLHVFAIVTTTTKVSICSSYGMAKFDSTLEVQLS